MPPPALQQPIKGLTSGSMKWSANKDDDGKKTPIYWGCVGKSACHYLKWRELSLHTTLEKIQKLPNIAIKKWQIGLLPKKSELQKNQQICWIIKRKKPQPISPRYCQKPKTYITTICYVRVWNLIVISNWNYFLALFKDIL